MSQLCSSNLPFSDAELRTLINLYIDHMPLLEQQHCPAVTEAKKATAWRKICEAVNASGLGSLRSVKQLKKKISDAKANARNWLRVQKNPPTGNKSGKKKLWYFDIVIDHIIGRDSPILDGVQGKCKTLVNRSHTCTHGVSLIN